MELDKVGEVLICPEMHRFGICGETKINPGPSEKQPLSLACVSVTATCHSFRQSKFPMNINDSGRCQLDQGWQVSTMFTRSSADADNGLDAFSGQSR